MAARGNLIQATEALRTISVTVKQTMSSLPSLLLALCYYVTCLTETLRYMHTHWSCHIVVVKVVTQDHADSMQVSFLM